MSDYKSTQTTWPATTINLTAEQQSFLCDLLAQLQASFGCGTAPSPSPAPGSTAWPTYTGTAQLVGTSKSGVTVYVDPTLGDPGMKNAQDLLADADRIVALNNQYFGTPSASTNVIIFALGGMTDGTGGADHMACDYVNGQNIEVCAAFGQSLRCSALFEAELSECSMNGNLCGYSTGEALSRWCAIAVSNNALADFATAPYWAQKGMKNWVDKTEQTDQGPESTGCGMAFLSWMLSQKYTLQAIAQNMVISGDLGTLTDTYSRLTGDAIVNAWPKFQAAITNLGGVSAIISDDPFNAGIPASICKIGSHALRKM